MRIKHLLTAVARNICNDCAKLENGCIYDSRDYKNCIVCNEAAKIMILKQIEQLSHKKKCCENGKNKIKIKVMTL